MDCSLEQDELDLQRIVRAVALDDLIALRCGECPLEAFDRLLMSARYGRLHFGCTRSPDIARRIPAEGDLWARIRDYCSVRFGDDFSLAHAAVEQLLRIYQPDNVGAWIGSGILDQIEPTLQFDDDQLLYGPAERIEFKSDVVLTEKYVIAYQSRLPSETRDAFVGEMISLAMNEPNRVSYLAFAVNRQAILERSYYEESFQRAYIRGPIGLDPVKLKDKHFPDDPSGVVTEHRRVGVHPVQDLMCPMERTEIMWSRRAGLKTVQIEELSPRKEGGMVSNRYVHSQWDTTQDEFVHLDGAVRSYSEGEYDRRLATDLKSAEKKATRYEKLFRIDGHLPIGTWSTLVSKFFSYNELVVEYLGGPEPVF